MWTHRLGHAFLAIITISFLGYSSAMADGVRPALLEITERTEGQFDVTWKNPMLGNQRLDLRPVLPESFSSVGESAVHAIPGAEIQRRRYKNKASSLAGETISIDGLSTTLTDALLRIELLSGETYSVVLRPSSPSFTIPKDLQEKPLAVLQNALRQGGQYGVSSISSILLLLAMVLGTRQFWPLLKILAIFSLGQSMAMVLADIGIPGPPEALSILFCTLAALLLAASVVRGARDPRLFWGPVFLAGLVSGLNQSHLYTETGVAQWNLLYSIFAFNLGFCVTLVLLGIAALVIFKGIRKIQFADKLKPVVAYTIGIFAVVVGMMAFFSPAAQPETKLPSDFLSLPTVGSKDANSTANRTPRPTSQPQDPMMAFLAIEPYEIRFEVLLRVKAFLEVTPALSGKTKTIQPEDQAQALHAILIQAGNQHSFLIDGKPAKPLVQRAEFVAMGTSGILPRPQIVPENVEDALIGLTFIYSHEGLPQNVTLDWKWFLPNVQSVVTTLTDPLDETQTTLTPAAPALRWQNRLVGFELPTINSVPVIPSKLPVISIALVLVSLPCLLLGLCKRRRIPMALAIICVVVAIGLYPFARSALAGSGFIEPTSAEAKEHLGGLLENVYRSFGLREEEHVYERLAKTVSGDQLSDIYLQSRRALELEARGGPRVTVDNVDILNIHSIKPCDDAFSIDAEWTVGGSVTHFGHTHFRQNRYRAIVDIAPENGVWKIRKIKLTEKQRQL